MSKTVLNCFHNQKKEIYVMFNSTFAFAYFYFYYYYEK